MLPVKPVFADKNFVITDFGAVSDPNFDNGPAIARAIAACAECGGGRVVIPSGCWVTSPIVLKSNVCLVAERGAYVLFPKRKESFPLKYCQYEGVRTIRAVSPISAENACNVGIMGEGIFDGDGESWRPKKDWKVSGREWQKLKTSPNIAKIQDGWLWFPTETAYRGYLSNLDESAEGALERAEEFYDWYRPVFVSFVRCTNLLIQGVTFTDSPNWTIHPLFCREVTVQGCTVKNPEYAQNSDGVDVESCQNVLIKNCSFDVGDDAICMKSGKGKLARAIVAPTQNVEVCGCTVYRGHGGFVVGSEMSRGVRNVFVHDCTFVGTDTGVRIKSKPGRGGYVRDISVRNITMSDIARDCITISMEYAVKTPQELAQEVTRFTAEDLPEFAGLHIAGVNCRSAARFLNIEGLKDSPVRDVVIEDCNITAKDGANIVNAQNVKLNNVTLNGKPFGY